ncbi:MAG: MarR family transcriptional regulator [Nocardia sp.]|nr:MarR family transcriptional regulator [Nocardia sp.]
MGDLLPRHALHLFALLTGGGLRTSDLSARLGVTRQATAQVVATLERDGYVTRIDDPGDGRARLVCLTARGRSALRVLRQSMLAVERDWEQTLGPDRLADLRQIVATLDAEHG